MNEHNYFVYITTNPNKTVLYVGITNDLERRIAEHKANRGKPDSFAGKYYCYNLVFWQRFDYVNDAIDAEKEIKDWTRAKKEELIREFNPAWKFLNEEIKED